MLSPTPRGMARDKSLREMRKAQMTRLLAARQETSDDEDSDDAFDLSPSPRLSVTKPE